MDLQNGKIGHRGPGYRLSEGDLKRRGRREECHEDLGSDAHLLDLSLGGTGFCTKTVHQSKQSFLWPVQTS